MSNRLINEKSPYLLEHAENPVDWFPWGEEAFEKARREDKPVFLSIGYSTCHWCHVMARESFENEAVAALLNKHFVSVKVDREERPDIDSVYMSVCTALTGSGGWPLTIIMTPEQKPFFAATYLPREGRGQVMGLMELLRAVSERWHGSRGSLLKTARELTDYLSRAQAVRGGINADAAFADRAAEQLSASFDAEYGGFGSSPKFPTPHILLFLLRRAALMGDGKAQEQVESTLRFMYRGGIFDHFGGGFCRYSTDREWLAPHFEKTLYDNALLAYTYTEAWQGKRMALHRQVAESTLDWCMREMLDHEGGYYCAQDADSEGVEGAYYLFTREEIADVLGAEAGRHFADCYDITAEGNFHGKSIPNLLINQRWNLLPEGYEDYREKLRLYREERMPLKTDTKILTSWNGLMLMALSKAAAAFSDSRYLAAAKSLAEFMGTKLYKDGRLHARLCDGELKFEARLDDYVFYALGLLELYKADYDPAHILDALELAGEIKARFSDGKGSFYSTAEDAEKLICRPRDMLDSAMPSACSGAAVLFDLLFRYTGDAAWRYDRDALLDNICAAAGDYPAGCAFALCALMNAVTPGRELLCVCPDENVPELLKAVTSRYAPELTVLLKTPQRSELLAKVAPFSLHAEAKDGKAAFFVCENGSCREGLAL